MCTLFETRDRMEACDYRSTGVPIGELFALTAAATWAIGSLIFAKIGERASPGAMNLGKCLAAAIVLTTLRALFSGSIGGVAWSNEAGFLLGVSGVVGGVVTMLQCVRVGAPWDRGTLSWFFLSAGVAFICAHLVLRYRRVPGV